MGRLTTMKVKLSNWATVENKPWLEHMKKEFDQMAMDLDSNVESAKTMLLPIKGDYAKEIETMSETYNAMQTLLEEASMLLARAVAVDSAASREHSVKKRIIKVKEEPKTDS